jgi:uncharacterized protein YjbI with pentapeptide repeats
MAIEEQLSILKQGVEVWNKWLIDNPQTKIDLSGADLKEVRLMGANLKQVNLSGADLRMAFLTLHELKNADLSDANLSDSFLNGADLSGARLWRTNLSQALLSQANLTVALLNKANLSGAQLSECNFLNARANGTIFGNVDLSKAIGLENVDHRGPSRISTDTFTRSKGKIPEVFLRGCGLRDWEIETVKLYDPELNNEERNKVLYKVYDLQANQAIQVSPLFISYSHGDREFVNKIGDCLTEKGIRYWRDIHDMKSGRMEKQIDRAIRQNPTVLLVLSKNSLSSDWVEHEVRTARALEKEVGRDVLCPVALDDSWKDNHWPKRIMEQIMEYNILDFSAWEDDVKVDSMFRRLIDGLELFYKG